MAEKIMVNGKEVQSSAKKKCAPELGNITSIIATAPGAKK